MFLFNRYTVFSMFFQFLVPVVIISTIYIRILLYLKVRRLFWIQYNSQNHDYKFWSYYKIKDNKLQIVVKLQKADKHLVAEQSSVSAKPGFETAKNKRDPLLHLNHFLHHMASIQVFLVLRKRKTKMLKAEPKKTQTQSSWNSRM